MLIIDVRDNIGDSDEFAYEVAGKFAEKNQLACLRKTEKVVMKILEKPKPCTLNQKESPSF